jgi:hypothetical protein
MCELVLRGKCIMTSLMICNPHQMLLGRVNQGECRAGYLECVGKTEICRGFGGGN